MGKICFFNTAKAWGGGEKWHFDTSQYLHQQGHEVFVLAHKHSVLLKKLVSAKIPCKGVDVSNLSFLNPFKYSRLIRIFKSLGAHTIIMNLSRDVKIAGPSAKRAGIGRIIYRRGSAIPIRNTFLNRYYFKNVLTGVLANSEATKKTVLQHNPNLFPKDQIAVIHNGIHIRKETSKTTVNQIFTLVNLGRLEFQKNQAFLVRLAAELKKRGLAFELHIGGSGSLQKELEMLITKFSVEKEVKLIGFIENPLEFIGSGHVFVLSSLWEGFGYVLAEAALCAKPIIAFNISSNPELVIHNKTGYLTKKNDITSFADHVMDLAENPKKREQLGIMGKQYVTANFDREKQLQKIESYLIHG